MSDLIEGAAAPEAIASPQVDEIKNIKAEFNRKLENQNLEMQRLLASMKAPAPEAKKVSVFDDEAQYSESIIAAAEKRIEAKLAAQNAVQAKHQQIVNSIVQDYPEANDSSSDLYKRAQEIYAALPEDDKASPLAMRIAVTSAAAETGLKPKSKRSAGSEDSYVSGSSPSRSSARPRQSESDSRTDSFAAIMASVTGDAKLQERVKARLQTKKR